MAVLTEEGAATFMKLGTSTYLTNHLVILDHHVEAERVSHQSDWQGSDSATEQFGRISRYVKYIYKRDLML